MEPSKKAYDSNNNTISKKETKILFDYYEGYSISSESLKNSITYQRIL